MASSKMQMRISGEKITFDTSLQVGKALSLLPTIMFHGLRHSLVQGDFRSSCNKLFCGDLFQDK